MTPCAIRLPNADRIAGWYGRNPSVEISGEPSTCWRRSWTMLAMAFDMAYGTDGKIDIKEEAAN